jgi:hypothetical protein
MILMLHDQRYELTLKAERLIVGGTGLLVGEEEETAR